MSHLTDEDRQALRFALAHYSREYDEGSRAYEVVEGIVASKVAEAEARGAERGWDEGHKHRQRRGPDGCRCGAWGEHECGCGKYGTGSLLSLADNPYRIGGGDRG